jgi:uncharacterized membrane protein YeaQ/YmgE (transglycosylase-associated protein family)
MVSETVKAILIGVVGNCLWTIIFSVLSYSWKGGIGNYWWFFLLVAIIFSIILIIITKRRMKKDTAISRLTNDKLRRESLEIVAGTRELLSRYKQRQNRTIYDDEYRYAKTEEDKQRAWDQKSLASSQSSTKLMADFSELYKVRAIVLKDELIRRLPPMERDTSINHMYTHPTNPIGVEMAIDDLERLAHLIPNQ